MCLSHTAFSHTDRTALVTITFVHAHRTFTHRKFQLAVIFPLCVFCCMMFWCSFSTFVNIHLLIHHHWTMSCPIQQLNKKMCTTQANERIKKQRIFCSFYLFARSNLYERQCIMNKIVWMIKVIHTSQLCVICKLPLHASNSTTCIDKMHDHWSCADRCLLYCVTAHIDEWRRSSEICVIFVVFTNTQFDELHRPFAHHQSAFYCSSIFRFSMRWFMQFC